VARSALNARRAGGPTPRRPPAKRRRKPAAEKNIARPLPQGIKTLLLALLLLPMIAGVLQQFAVQMFGPTARSSGWILLVVLLILPVVLRSAGRSWRDYCWRRRCLAAIRTAFLAHADKLALNRARLVQTDDYGVEDTDRWLMHLQRFVDKVVVPHLPPRQQAFFAAEFRSFAIALLDEAARQKRTRALGSLKPGRKLSGRDFEQFCMEELRKQDWRARATGASGDQGADIIAEHKGRAVVFQCKYHSAPIGNKAVQEVAAARQHYQAQAACVVSNQGYTRGARALAATNNVFLIHYSELAGFKRLAFAR
jgi:restriction system protein